MLTRPMPSQVIDEDGSKDVSDGLSKLTSKEVEFNKLKISISKKEEEISKLQEHVKNKEKIIVEVKNTKITIRKEPGLGHEKINR